MWFIVAAASVVSCYFARVCRYARVYCSAKAWCLDPGYYSSGHPLKMMVVATSNTGPSKPLRSLLGGILSLYGSVLCIDRLRFWSHVNTWSLLHRKAPWHFQHSGDNRLQDLAAEGNFLTLMHLHDLIPLFGLIFLILFARCGQGSCLSWESTTSR